MVQQGPFQRCLLRTSLSETPTQEPSAANDSEEDYIFPTHASVTDLSKITKESKGKAQTAKSDVSSFPLAPSPWKHQSTALYLGFASAVLSAIHTEESGCPSISLTVFPTTDTEDAIELDFHWQGRLWKQRSVIRQKENNRKSQWFGIFIAPPPLFFSEKQSCMAVHPGILVELRKIRFVTVYF